ncbi:maleylpyruvate isomerase family mycothiol-dependent enzyme [Actinophytocola sp.]|uniref:maleylpyruvate isomerase family mycothiol-dependent enzyme n=1 Tax=Actinophytocola sp. TaxID=1872138 RepID=UPI0025C1164D|nr:maleylpyruvate isomerase family mycothiol-dependent enzyme [Actinophytocola sp.]
MTALDLARAGERVLLAAFDRPVRLRAPSGLPGWTRAHLVAHLIGNAGALGNLLAWARTGVETPMYATRAARAEQIGRDVQRPDDWLVTTMRESSASLLDAMTELTPARWDHPVRSALGRSITAAEVPWMRARESFVHLVDLDLGVTFDDLPAEFLEPLLDDATRTVGGKAGCPALRLVAGPHSWPLAGGGAEVTGTVADLAAWVTGRSRPAGRPALPAWL